MVFYFTPDQAADPETGMGNVVYIEIPFGITTVIIDATATYGIENTIFCGITFNGGTLANGSIFTMNIVNITDDSQASCMLAFENPNPGGINPVLVGNSTVNPCNVYGLSNIVYSYPASSIKCTWIQDYTAWILTNN